MSHAAKPYGPKSGGTYVERARNAWGTVPDKVMALALRADLASSLSEVADLLGYSVSAISSVINNAYQGRLDRVFAKIDGLLMSAEVYCPAAGMNIPRNACADNQQRKKQSSATPYSAKFPAACRNGCPNAFGGTNAQS